MDIKLVYLLGAMGILGVFAGLYHLVFGAYSVMSLISVIVSFVFVGLAYQHYRKGKQV